jgi:hypothetical protein
VSGSGLTRHHPKPRLKCRVVVLDQGILRSIERGNSSGIDWNQLTCDDSLVVEFIQPQIKHGYSMEVQFRALELYIHTRASHIDEKLLYSCHYYLLSSRYKRVDEVPAS